MKTKVYIAGPDVFYPDAIARLTKIRRLCESLGFEGLIPVDVANLCAQTPQELGSKIMAGNLSLVRETDIVLANLTPFRSQSEPDSGTVFECAFGLALQKRIVAYDETFPLSLKDKIVKECGYNKENVNYDGKYGMLIEDFGYAQNLMLGANIPVFKTPFEALKSCLVHSN